MRSGVFLPCRPAAERGAALMLVLVVLILVMSLAVSLAQQYDFDLRRGANREYAAQGQQYLSGAESLAIIVLRQDLRKGSVSDNLGEQWAQDAPSFPVEGGEINAQLEDAQGRFNVNQLPGRARSASAIPGAAGEFTTSQRRFIRLLQTFEDLPIDEAQAIELTEALIDWLDEDDQPTGFGGAESIYYQQQVPSYLPANQPMVDLSELQLVRHFTPELIALLVPYLSAVPDSAGININTASPRLLRTVNIAADLAPLSDYSGDSLEQRRGGSGFASVEAFLNSPELSDLARERELLLGEGLSVESNYFILQARAVIGGKSIASESLLERTEYSTFVLRRKYL